jgi:signal peptidase
MLGKEKGGGSKVPKERNKKLLFYMTVGFAILAGLLIFWFSFRAYLAVDNPFYVVPSESMIPTLNVGDVVMIRNGAEGYSFDDVKVGDIIVFHTIDGGGRTIVHRVVEIYSDSHTGDRLLKTKGDNNPQSYENFDYPIKRQDYYGKVVAVIPKIGLLSTMLRP